jgi:hypothetical protein
MHHLPSMHHLNQNEIFAFSMACNRHQLDVCPVPDEICSVFCKTIVFDFLQTLEAKLNLNFCSVGCTVTVLIFYCL